MSLCLCLVSLRLTVDHELYDFDAVSNSVAEQGGIPVIIRAVDKHARNVGVAEQALAALCQVVSTHGTSRCRSFALRWAVK